MLFSFVRLHFADLQLDTWMDEGTRKVAPCDLICDVHYVLSFIPSCLRIHLLVTYPSKRSEILYGIFYYFSISKCSKHKF